MARADQRYNAAMTSQDNTCLAGFPACVFRYRQPFDCDDAGSAATNPEGTHRVTSPANKAYVAKGRSSEGLSRLSRLSLRGNPALKTFGIEPVTSEWSHHIIMDHYPEVNVEVQEYPSSASRHDSASSVTKVADFHSPPSLVPSRQSSHTMSSTAAPSNTSAQQRTTSNPPASDAAEPQERKDSIHTDEQTAEKLKAEFARYTDAPPPFSEEQYENKTEEQQLSMRAQDYAKELSRMMGRQLVRGLKTNDPEER